MRPEDSPRQPQKWLALIFLAYWALAFYRIDHQSLWVDEVLSVRYAALDGSLFSRSIWLRGHGPLYFALLHIWGQFGTSELFLRSLSVLFGSVTIYLMYRIGVVLWSQRVALIGAALLATSPFLIWYSQEVRYNALMMATALLATYAFLRVLSADRPWWWLAYGASLLLAFAAFVANILLPVIHGLYLTCVRSHRPLWKKWLTCQILLAAIFLWWANGGTVSRLDGYCLRLYNEMTVSEKQGLDRSTERLASGGAKEVTPTMLPYTVFAFSVGYSLGPSVRELQVSRSLATLLPHLPTLLILGVLFGGLCGFGLKALWHAPGTGLFLALWIVVSLLGVYAVSAFTGMAYNARYAAMAFPAYVLVVALGIGSIRGAAARVSALVLVLAVNGVALAHYYFDPRYGREDARAAVRYLETVYQPRDAILYVGNGTALHYYNEKDLPLTKFAKGEIRQWAAVSGRLRELGEAYDRLWLVTIRPWQVDPKGKIKVTLDQSYPVSQEKHFAGVSVYCYEVSRRHTASSVR
ncbi:MAG: glycosyltransferase family 39 protein [Thermodesulfobacteriota bacterium]|jgi:4-amino-4-deoxy-L-arabinose transferase-like glycosyltransferase